MNPTKTEFDALYSTHYPDVHRFVFHLVQDVSLADELTQDAFLKAYESWGSFRGEAPERIWLLRIARNVCLDYLRSPRSRARAAASFEQVQADGQEFSAESAAVVATAPLASVEQAARQAEMTDCVQRFVLSLPETLRTALILHDMEGLTNVQIAQVLGCSVEAAKTRLHRARVRLRDLMEERCDLFHDERNVLTCLPAAPDQPDAAREGAAALRGASAP